MRPAALIEFRRIDLDPPPNAAGIHLEAPLGKHLSYVLVSQRISQVPPHGQQDHLSRVVTSFEWIARRDWHRSTVSPGGAQSSQWNPGMKPNSFRPIP